MSDEDCTIEKEKNIIELLLEKDLTRICFKIFSHLDSDSFCNARLVCHGWKDFIDYQFYELPKGIKWRSDKLISNFLNEDFIPREEEINLKHIIYYTETDGKYIFLSTYYYPKNYSNYSKANFYVSKYEINLWKLVWSLKLEELDGPAVLHLCYGKLYAFVQFSITGGIYVIDSTSGSILHKINNFPSLDDRYRIKDLCVLDNKALALGTISKMNIYNIEVINKPKLIYEADWRRDLDSGPGGLQNDEDKLIYPKSYNDGHCVGFIARNFNTGEKISEIQAELIPRFKNVYRVHWPYLICTGKNLETIDGIRIFDMENETLIKHILWNFTLGINIKGKVVLLHSVKDNKIETRYLSFEDIMNDNMSEIENISSRQIGVSTWDDKYFIAGNCVFKVSTQDIVKKSYWMSINFDDKSKTESEVPMKKKRRVKN